MIKIIQSSPLFEKDSWIKIALVHKMKIHDLLIKLLKLDIPTNYEEKMVDLNTRNNLELELKILFKR
jgi:hypothetical protein